MTRQEVKGNREEVLVNFIFRYILISDKPLRVYGFFVPSYLLKHEKITTLGFSTDAKYHETRYYLHFTK